MSTEVVEASFIYFVSAARGTGVQETTEQAVTVTVNWNSPQTVLYAAVLKHYLTFTPV